MQYFVCHEHKVAWPERKQSDGHLRLVHRIKGPLPEAPQMEESEIPSDYKNAGPPPEPKAKKPEAAGGTGAAASPQTPSATLPGSPPPPRTPVPPPLPAPVGIGVSDEVDDELERKAQSLYRKSLSAGIPEAACRIAYIGCKEFSYVWDHPAQMAQFLAMHYPPKYHRQGIPMVVHELFKPEEQGDGEAQFYFQDYGQPGGGPPMFGGFAQHQGYRDPYARSYPPQWGPPGYYPPTPPRQADKKEEENPEVKELRALVLTMKENMEQERRERALERAADEERRKEQELESRFGQVENSIVAVNNKIGQVLEVIQTQQQSRQTTAEASALDGVKAEVTQLRTRLEDEKDKNLQTQIEAARLDRERLQGQLEEIKLSVAKTPTGRTQEDLVSEGFPVLMDKLDSGLGRVTEELQGIRESASNGRLPILHLPIQPVTPGSPGSAVQDAQHIAQTRGLENSILAKAGRK